MYWLIPLTVWQMLLSFFLLRNLFQECLLWHVAVTNLFCFFFTNNPSFSGGDDLKAWSFLSQTQRIILRLDGQEFFPEDSMRVQLVFFMLLSFLPHCVTSEGYPHELDYNRCPTEPHVKKKFLTFLSYSL